MSVLNTLNISNINNVCVSWHYQNVIPNLKTRFVQFKDQKNPEIVQKVQIELSINTNSKRSQIKTHVYISGHLQDMFYDSKTQHVQFTDQ